MAKFMTLAQLQKEFSTTMRSLKELMLREIYEPVKNIADQARALADSVRRDADEGAFDGEPGADGYSPTVHVSEIAGGYRVSITDASGVHEYIAYNGQDGQDGQDGADGEDGYSPTVSVEEITGGHRVTITDADGTQQFDVLNGEKGEPGDVTDVQVAGESVVTDGVATIPYAGSSQAGVVKASATYGLSVNSSNHLLIISSATETNIDNRTTYKPVVSSKIDYAVKAAMTDGVGAAWTDAEKAAGRERMGAASESMVSDAWTSRTWTVGEICIYNNKLWRCKVGNSVAPSEGANWTETSLAAEMGNGTIEVIPITYVDNIYCTSENLDRCFLYKTGKHTGVLHFNLQANSADATSGFKDIASLPNISLRQTISHNITPQNGSDKAMVVAMYSDRISIYGANGIDAVFYRAEIPVIFN